MKFWRVVIRAREVQEIVLYSPLSSVDYDRSMFGKYDTTQRIYYPQRLPKRGEANFYANAFDELGAYAAFREWMGETQ
jgi:hypothetical protein